MSLILGWGTFFVLLYFFPSYTLAGMLCIGWVVMIWAQICNSGMARSAAIAGWLVGAGTFVLLFALIGPIGGAVCSDGWASPSIGRQGACSHHGGVSQSGGIAATAIFFASIYVGHFVAKKLDKSD